MEGVGVFLLVVGLVLVWREEEIVFWGLGESWRKLGCFGEEMEEDAKRRDFLRCFN